MAPMGLVTVGGCRAAVLEAQARLGAQGLHCDVMRIRAFPFGPEVRAFLEGHERVFVVEQNRDAQLLGLLVTEAGADRERLVSVRRYGGLPLAAGQVVEGVLEALGEPPPGRAAASPDRPSASRDADDSPSGDGAAASPAAPDAPTRSAP
jgi:2-oxoglutarate ferredoxin oxidoreductase subunit alpha